MPLDRLSRRAAQQRPCVTHRVEAAVDGVECQGDAEQLRQRIENRAGDCDARDPASRRSHRDLSGRLSGRGLAVEASLTGDRDRRPIQGGIEPDQVADGACPGYKACAGQSESEAASAGRACPGERRQVAAAQVGGQIGKVRQRSLEASDVVSTRPLLGREHLRRPLRSEQRAADVARHLDRPAREPPKHLGQVDGGSILEPTAAGTDVPATLASVTRPPSAWSRPAPPSVHALPPTPTTILRAP